MKFRDFVGYEGKVESIVEKEEEKIQFHFGHPLSKKSVKVVFDYIRSWFIRYNIPFKPINPYLNLYVLNNMSSIDGNLENEAAYKFKGTITVISENKDLFPKVYDIRPKKNKEIIVLDFINQYSEKMKEVFKEEDIKVISEGCYIKLFEIKSGLMNHRTYEEMVYSMPLIENVKANSLSIIRRY